jgi:iron complex outermembrane recepter protein
MTKDKTITSPYNHFIFWLFITFLTCQVVDAQSQSIVTGKVSDQFGVLPGAKISIEGSDLNTTTNVNGVFKLNLDEGDYVITASFVMYSAVSKTISLKVGETNRLDFVLETSFSIDEPISIASRGEPTSLLHTTEPVDVISHQQLESVSHLELSQVLQYLIPSFHSTRQTIADGTDHVDPATLRGLGPDQILVLINGKRRHNSSLLNLNGTVGKGTVGIDFNTIPVAAIDRIEVLRDGATSQYGSDAIAGVINIILKKQTEVIDVDSKVKVNSKEGNISSSISANFGIKIGKEGFINVTGEVRQRQATNRAGAYTGTVYSKDPLQDAILINQNNFYNTTGYSKGRVMEIGSAQNHNLALTFNGSFPISDIGEVYFQGGRNYRQGKSKGFYRFPKDQNLVVLALYPNGFSPEILTDIQDDAITAGIKGTKNGWKLDFSHSIGTNSMLYTVNNSNNASLGVKSPRTFYCGGYEYKLNTTNFDASKSFDWLSGINIAFGGEARVENYIIVPGDEASYIDGKATFTDELGVEHPRAPGAQVFPGIKRENELKRFRTNTAGYVDVETAITKKLLIKTAARYEFYNDFGGQPIWKISGRYLINDKLSIRAGYSTGFRAPSLHQVFFQNISTQFVNNEIVQVGTFNNESPIVSEAFKIGKLKPELSKHMSIGFSGKYSDNFTFSFDYYSIKIEDRIVLSGRFASGYETLLKPFNVGAAQFFTNAIDSKTTGVDISLNYITPLANGQFTSFFGANFTKTSVVGPVKVNEVLKGQEEVLFNREEIARIESAQPNFKLNSLMSYEVKKVKFQLVNTLFGAVKYIDPNDGNPANWVLNKLTNTIESRDQTFSPKVVTDMAVSYQILDFLKFSLGVNNIFNVYPDKHKHSENINNGNFIYSRRVQQFGVDGANFYSRLLIRL